MNFDVTGKWSTCLIDNPYKFSYKATRTDGVIIMQCLGCRTNKGPDGTKYTKVLIFSAVWNCDKYLFKFCYRLYVKLLVKTQWQVNQYMNCWRKMTIMFVNRLKVQSGWTVYSSTGAIDKLEKLHWQEFHKYTKKYSMKWKKNFFQKHLKIGRVRRLCKLNSSKTSALIVILLAPYTGIGGNGYQKTLR